VIGERDLLARRLGVEVDDDDGRLAPRSADPPAAALEEPESFPDALVPA